MHKTAARTLMRCIQHDSRSLSRCLSEKYCSQRLTICTPTESVRDVVQAGKLRHGASKMTSSNLNSRNQPNKSAPMTLGCRVDGMRRCRRGFRCCRGRTLSSSLLTFAPHRTPNCQSHAAKHIFPSALVLHAYCRAATGFIKPMNMGSIALA